MIAVATMATAGELFGPFGALATGVTTIGAIVLLLGRDYFTPGARLVVSFAVGVALLSVVVVHVLGWPAFSSQPAVAEGGAATRARPAEGTDLAGRRLRDRDIASRDLRGARLAGANLDRLSLPDADLSSADAKGASLRGAVLDGANLANVTLSGADLQLALLRRTDLRGADLRGADLRGADLSGSCLQGADLSGARVDGADFFGAATMQVTVEPAAIAVARDWPKKPTAASCR
ncbi:pentapeptide repeat-containing protein [Actinoplanes sp. TBRC 11911]|uniref:pentapeptide repeat-containing protein n=1 Tax=Actinoplanes sp. TBRC 11911 TaxID=2729386 RepID=UPI00145E974C|nr:pentapeptide repeat-containing protein [Actinoplanes sp. TBRC 11911]NMO57304.1 pentapeptide repeat-containing protein [Actinoplanes sp. TBRC 11911]